MDNFDPKELKKLYVPAKNSHKGENGKLLLIAGSVLFHSASLWPLEVASRIVDMVYYSSIPQNNEIIQNDKEKFRNGIIVPRAKIDNYIQEADCILIGPGLPREDGQENADEDTKVLTERLLKKYPNKKWVIDGGSLQETDPSFLPQNSIITPHHKEFETIEFKSLFRSQAQNKSERVRVFAKEYGCVVVLKGETDIISDGTRTVKIQGGNQGMTKGGTGDVLAGLTASLYCKNDAFLSATCASYINKKAGENLYKRMGIYYNASDLAEEIPLEMKELIL